MAFTALVLGNLGLILATRSYSARFTDMLRRDNPALWGVMGATLVALSAVLWFEPAREIFRFGSVSWGQLLICVAAAGVTLLWFEACKYWSRPAAHGVM